jgi:hypothetical protein
MGHFCVQRHCALTPRLSSEVAKTQVLVAGTPLKLTAQQSMLHEVDMTEKRRLTHDLAAIKAALASPPTLNRTKVATRDASAIGMDAAAVVAVIQALRYPADFDKSATAHHSPQQWHDSYKPIVDQRTFYLKFTIDDEGKFLLTSFKEA